MVFTPTTAAPQPLGDGLTLRTPTTLDHVDRIAAFNDVIHDSLTGPFIRRILLRYPYTAAADHFYIENADGEIISSLCLVAWTLEIEGVALPVGEMGVVGTHAAYRRRGLVRTLVAPFMRRLAARGCLLSFIQGIPYFYRQFGYDYALPLEGGWRIEFRHIPAEPPAGYTVRLAQPNDFPAIMRFYEEARRDYAITVRRDPAVWEFLLETQTPPDATSHRTLVVEDADGMVAGYARLPYYHFDAELTVDEASRLREAPAVALLAHLRTLAQTEGAPGIRLNLPSRADLVRLARALGAHDLGTYAWQVHIPNIAALLAALAPVLEARLATSLFAGLTETLPISFYRDGLTLQFAGGRLTDVAAWRGGEHDAAIWLPLQAVTPLLLGHRSVEELRAAFPDVNVHGRARLLLETLFPTRDAWLAPPY